MPAGSRSARSSATSETTAARGMVRPAARAAPRGRDQRTREQVEQPREHGAQLGARPDRVDHAVLEQELGALEAARQLLADGLLDDAGPGEADERARPGQVRVAQEGEGGRHAAGGGIGHQRDERDAARPQPGQRRADLRHLEEREDALLHARAPRGRDHDQGEPLRGGVLDEARQALADAAPHAAAEEGEVEHAERNRMAADARRAGDDRLLPSRLVPDRRQPLRIRASVAEAERVGRAHLGIALAEGAPVDGDQEALLEGQAQVVAAAWADGEPPLDELLVVDLPAARALLPDRGSARPGRGGLALAHAVRAAAAAPIALLSPPRKAATRAGASRSPSSTRDRKSVV